MVLSLGDMFGSIQKTAPLSVEMPVVSVQEPKGTPMAETWPVLPVVTPTVIHESY